MNYYLLFFIFLFSFSYGFCQNDTLPMVQVEASKINSPSPTYKVLSLEVENKSTLSEVLKKETGLYLKTYGIGSLTTVSIRGANASQTQLIWNGFTINSPTLGQNDLAITSVSMVDNASLHLGASSLVNTSGGLGGAIQLSNRPDFKKGVNLFLSKEMGSFEIDNTALKIKAGNYKWQSFTGIIKKHAKNNFTYRDFLQTPAQLVKQQNAMSDQIEFAQNIYYQLSPKHLFSLKTNFVTSQRYLPPIMGVKTKGEHQEDQSLKSSLSWSYKANKYFQQVAIGYFYDYLNYIDTASAIDSKITTKAIKAYYKARYYVADNMQLKWSLNSGNVSAVSSGFDSQKQQYRNAVYLEFFHRLKNKLTYTASIRKEIITDISTPLLPAFSLKWNKWKELKVFSSVALNYRVPTFNDLYWNPGGNPNLQPENGFLSELGIEFNKKNYNLNVTAYYSLIDNWIQWLPTNKGYWQPQNIKQVESKGVEFSLKKHLKIKHIAISLKGNYNLVLSTNKASLVPNDASVGKQLIYVPKNTAGITIDANYKQLNFAYAQAYNGSVFIDASNQTYMPYFAPASLSVNWKLTKKDAKTLFDIGIKIENLYNEEYQVMANRPMPGRYFLFVLKLESKR